MKIVSAYSTEKKWKMLLNIKRGHFNVENKNAIISIG